MASIREEAMAFEPKRTLNVADLPEVSVDLQVHTREGINSEGKPFSYDYIELNGEEYRVPSSVISMLKEILAVKPGLKRFKVTKSGQGLNVKYAVVPLD